MRFPSLKYMATHGIYSVKDLFAEHTVKNEILDKECPKCCYVYEGCKLSCDNCYLKK